MTELLNCTRKDSHGFHRWLRGTTEYECTGNRQQMVTYRRKDGEPVAGEYSFVMDREYFEDPFDNWDKTEVVQETWELVKTVEMVLGPASVFEDDED